MTATEELRRLLDGRGVEWWEGEDSRKTLWESRGLTWEYFNDENGDAWLGFLGACESDVSPAQAVEATLGRAYEPPFAGRWDGDVLVLTLPRDPSSIHVQRAEGQPRLVYPAEATLGRGECRDVCNSVSEFTCSACGFNCDLMSWISLFDWDVGRYRHHHHGTPNYCPNCGRKVVTPNE